MVNKKKTNLEKVLSFFELKDPDNYHSRFIYNKHSTNWSYQGVIDYDYENDREGCDCPDYCRCGRIVNTKTSNFNINNLINTITDFGKTPDEILTYCVDRVVRSKKLENDDFEVATCGGYYGEEIDGVYLDNTVSQKLYDSLKKLENLSDIEMIKYVLEIEYGYLLEELKNTQTVKIKDISINDISFQEDYRKKVDISENYYDEKFTLPRGIFLPKDNNKFRLIDGYHRVVKAKSLNLTTIKGIILK